MTKPNRWDQFAPWYTTEGAKGAAAVVAAPFVAAKNAVTGAYDAAGRLLQGGYEPGQGDTQAVDDAATAGGVAMAGGLGRAGATGRAVELGAGGGRLTAERAAQIMREEGYQNVRIQPAKSGESTYVVGDPAGNPPRPGSPQTMVRVPADEHIGRAARGREAGSRFDTGTDPTIPGGVPRRDPVDDRVLLNQAGEPYANPEALRAGLRWKAGGLVRPDQAPRGIREQAPLEQPPRQRPEGPDLHPDQQKLLARGIPIPSEGGWETTVQREPDAGRFARPSLAGGTSEMARDTRTLTDQVRAAADDIATVTGGPVKYQGSISDEKRSDLDKRWNELLALRAQLGRFGKQIGRAAPEIPEMRESANVEDQRTIPWEQFLRAAQQGAR